MLQQYTTIRQNITMIFTSENAVVLSFTY